MVPIMDSKDKRSKLQSAAHWLDQINAAETEDRHEVVVRLFELALECGAQPAEEIVEALQACRERYSQKWVASVSDCSTNPIVSKDKNTGKGRSSLSSSKTPATHHRKRSLPTQERTGTGNMNVKRVMGTKGNNVQNPAPDWLDRVVVTELPLDCSHGDACPAVSTVRIPVGRSKATKMVLTTHKRGNSLELHVTHHPASSEEQPVDTSTSREDVARQSLQDLRRTVNSIVGNTANVPPRLGPVVDTADSKTVTDEDMTVDSLSAFSEDGDSTDRSEAVRKTSEYPKIRCSYRSGGGTLSDSDDDSTCSDDGEDGSQSFRSIDIRSETDDDVSLAEIRAAMKNGLKLSSNDVQRRHLSVPRDPSVGRAVKLMTPARNHHLLADFRAHVRCIPDTAIANVNINAKVSASLLAGTGVNRRTGSNEDPLISQDTPSQEAADLDRVPETERPNSLRPQIGGPGVQSECAHMESPMDIDVGRRHDGDRESAPSLESSADCSQAEVQTPAALTMNDAPFGEECAVPSDAPDCYANAEAVGSSEGKQETFAGAASHMMSFSQVSEGFSATTPLAVTTAGSSPKVAGQRSPRRPRHSRSWSMIGGILDHVSEGRPSTLLSGFLAQEAQGGNWQATFPWRRSFGGDFERGFIDSLPGRFGGAPHPQCEPQCSRSATATTQGISGRTADLGPLVRASGDCLQRSLDFENVPISPPIRHTPGQILSGTEPSYTTSSGGSQFRMTMAGGDEHKVGSINDESSSTQSGGGNGASGVQSSGGLGWRPFESPLMGDSAADSSRTPTAQDSGVRFGGSQLSFSSVHDGSTCKMKGVVATELAPDRESDLKRQVLSPRRSIDSTVGVEVGRCQAEAAEVPATKRKGHRNFVSSPETGTFLDDSFSSKDRRLCSDDGRVLSEEGDEGTDAGRTKDNVAPMAKVSGTSVQERVPMSGSQCKLSGSNGKERSDSFLSLRSILNSPMYTISDSDDSSNDECESVQADPGQPTSSHAGGDNVPTSLSPVTTTTAVVGTKEGAKNPEQRAKGGWLRWRPLRKDLVSSSSGESGDEAAQKSITETCGNEACDVKEDSRSEFMPNSDEQYQLAVSMNSRNSSRPFRFAKEMTIDEDEEFHDVDSAVKTLLCSPPPSPVAANAAIRSDKSVPRSVRSHRVRPNIYSSFSRMRQQAAARDSPKPGTPDDNSQNNKMDFFQANARVADARANEGRADPFEVDVVQGRSSGAMSIDKSGIDDEKGSDRIAHHKGYAEVSAHLQVSRLQVEHASADEILLHTAVAEAMSTDLASSKTQGERMAAGDNTGQGGSFGSAALDQATTRPAVSLEGRCGGDEALEKSCNQPIASSLPQVERMGWPLHAIHQRDSSIGKTLVIDGQQVCHQQRDDNNSDKLLASGQGNPCEHAKASEMLTASEAWPLVCGDEAELGGKGSTLPGNVGTDPDRELQLKGLVSLGSNTPSRDKTSSGIFGYGVGLLGSISHGDGDGEKIGSDVLRSLPPVHEEEAELGGGEDRTSSVSSTKPGLQLKGLVSLGANTPSRDYPLAGSAHYGVLGLSNQGHGEGQKVGPENVKALPPVHEEEAELGVKDRTPSPYIAANDSMQFNGLVSLGANTPNRDHMRPRNRRCGVLGMISQGRGVTQAVRSKGLDVMSVSTVHASCEVGGGVVLGHPDPRSLGQDADNSMCGSSVGCRERQKAVRGGHRLDMVGSSAKGVEERKRRRRTIGKIARLCCFL